MVTIKDVAKACGLGVSTVSYALNGSKQVSNATKERVKKVADELEYVPNSYARSLKRNKANKIGVIVPDFGGPIHSAILFGMAERLTNTDYQMIVTMGNNSLNLIKDRTVDIAIIMDARMSDEMISSVKGLCPIILYDRTTKNDDMHYVSLQNEHGIYEETTYLIRKGIKRIAFLKGPHSSYHNKERYMGYFKAMQDAGLKEYITEYDADSYIEIKGYELMNAMMADKKELPFEGLVCSNDELAIGAIRALSEYGFHSPQDYLVAGFDNNIKAELITPKLTTIDVNWGKCGASMVEYALSILDSLEVNHNLIIPSTLIVRESTEK